MVQRLTLVVVVILAATAIYKLSSLRRGALPAQFALAGVFVCLAVGVLPFTGWQPEVLGEEQSARGWGDVIARTFVAAAAGLAQVYLLLLAETRADVRARVARRLVAAGLVAASIVALGASTPAWASATAQFDVWPEAAMHLLFQVYLAVALGDVALAACRWSRACTGVVRTGLRLVAAGSVLGIVYAIGKVVATGVELAGTRSEVLVTTFQLIALTGLVLVATGSVLPGVVRAWRSARHVVSTRRRLDSLYPLWSDLVDVAPGIALEPVEPRWRDRLHVRDLDLRLYRRVIEIRDGQLALGRPDATRTGIGRTADLRLALAPVPDGRERPTTVDEEVAWWSQVSTSYARLRRADDRAVTR